MIGWSPPVHVVREAYGRFGAGLALAALGTIKMLSPDRAEKGWEVPVAAVMLGALVAAAAMWWGAAVLRLPGRLLVLGGARGIGWLRWRDLIRVDSQPGGWALVSANGVVNVTESHVGYGILLAKAWSHAHQPLEAAQPRPEPGRPATFLWGRQVAGLLIGILVCSLGLNSAAQSGALMREDLPELAGWLAFVLAGLLHRGTILLAAELRANGLMLWEPGGRRWLPADGFLRVHEGRSVYHVATATGDVFIPRQLRGSETLARQLRIWAKRT